MLDRPRRPTFDREMWLPRVHAWWEGRCPECGENVESGDAVYKDPDRAKVGAFPWICRGCAETRRGRLANP